MKNILRVFGIAAYLLFFMFMWSVAGALVSSASTMAFIIGIIIMFLIVVCPVAYLYQKLNGTL